MLEDRVTRGWAQRLIREYPVNLPTLPSSIWWMTAIHSASVLLLERSHNIGTWCTSWRSVDHRPGLTSGYKRFLFLKALYYYLIYQVRELMVWLYLIQAFRFIRFMRSVVSCFLISILSLGILFILALNIRIMGDRR
jgi:hypothetical protein